MYISSRVLPFLLKIKMDDNPVPSFSIIIPSDLVKKFTEVSSRNLCPKDGKLVETLGFAIGREEIENNGLIISELIIPRQTSLPASVEDKGKIISICL